MKKTFLLCILIINVLLGAQTVYGNEILQRIDTKDYPTVRLSLSYTVLDDVDSSGQDKQDISVVENGRRIEDLIINTSKISSKVKPEPLSIVMLIDSSGSMKGKPIEDAKAAASHFIGKLGEEDQISIISFSSEPELVVDYTSDKDKLANSINVIEATGETAVYDALSLAANQVSKSNLKQKYIILLSDGGDTVSKADPTTCIAKLKDIKVPVYTIALKTPEFDIGALENITKQSGGKLVEAIDSSELKPFYSRLAEKIKNQNQVEIEYQSPGVSAKDINVSIAIGSGGDAIRVSTVYKNPFYVGAHDGGSEPFEMQPIADNQAMRLGILLVVFLASALLVYGAITTIRREKSVLREQIGIYENIWSKSEGSEEKLSADLNPYISKALDIVGHFAEKRGFTGLAKEKLEQAGLPLRPVEYIFFHSLIVIIPSVLLQLLYGNLIITVPFIFFLTVIPMLVIQALIDRRKSKFDEMLPDVITMLAGSLRAGYSLIQAVSLVADESKPPVSVEFKRAITEARLGLPVDVALGKMAKRIGSEDLYWTVIAINIQREVGGNLAEVLDIVASTIREREALKRHVKALTAEGRLSAYILIALPFAIFALLLVTNPEYVGILFSHAIGWAMVGIAGVLMVIGIIWMKKLISIEV